jgi:hypothetical protein
MHAQQRRRTKTQLAARARPRARRSRRRRPCRPSLQRKSTIGVDEVALSSLAHCSDHCQCRLAYRPWIALRFDKRTSGDEAVRTSRLSVVERFAVHEVREGRGERVVHVLEASSTHKCSRVLTSTHECSPSMRYAKAVANGWSMCSRHILRIAVIGTFTVGRTTQLSVSTPSEVPA